MELNKETYEIWMIDYFDGNLNEQQIIELRNFLIMHPELDCDLEEDLVSLEQETLTYDEKSLLTKSVSYKKFEDLSVSSIEGLLNAEEDFKFKKKIKQDALLDKHFRLFELSKLEAENITYPYKSELRKTKVVRFPLKKLIQYGAVAACLIGVVLWFYSSSQSSSSSYLADSNSNTYQEVEDNAPTFDFQEQASESIANIIKAKNVSPVPSKLEPIEKLEDEHKEIPKQSLIISASSIEIDLATHFNNELPRTLEIKESNVPSNLIESKIKKAIEKEMPSDWEKYTFIDKIALAVNRIGKETDTNIHVETAKNEKGQIVNWAVNLGKIRISQ